MRNLLILVIFLMIGNVAKAQEVYILELQESGTHYLGQGMAEAQVLSALNSTKFKVAPRYDYGNRGNNQESTVRVVLSLSNQDATVSSSSNFGYSNSYSQNTKIYSNVALSATFFNGTWVETVVVNLSDSVSFVERAETSFSTGRYAFSIPTVNSREQRRIELNNRLLNRALAQFSAKVNQLQPPVQNVVQQYAPDVLQHQSALPVKRMKVRLSPTETQKYIQLGYIRVLRNRQIVQYRIVRQEGDVLTIEYTGDPLQSNDQLY